MSTNCIRCASNKRTGIDLICDYCRAGVPQAVAIEIGCLKSVEIASREMYSQSAIVRRGKDEMTESGHFNFIVANDDLHSALVHLDTMRSAIK